MDINQLMAASVKQNASDLHLSAGNLPMLRVDGVLQPIAEQVLAPLWLEQQLQGMFTEAQWALLLQDNQLDCALTFNHIRIRVNLFRQYHGISAVFRFIPTAIPQLKNLAAPAVLDSLLREKSGLILMTGATGCGKSTTLAAMIQEINLQQKRHIITLEDPIEFIHISAQSLIQQRQITTHVNQFENGLHAALREDPDIILLGELRHPKVISLALTAAETGHLVLATLHTSSAIQGVERIIDVVPAEDKSFVRAQLAHCLRAVTTQQLLPKVGGGRIAAYEVLINTPAVANLIREGKTHQLYSLLQTGQSLGMQSMAQAIDNLHTKGLIKLLLEPTFQN